MKANDAKKGYKGLGLRILIDMYLGNGRSGSGTKVIGNKIVQTANTVGNALKNIFRF